MAGLVAGRIGDRRYRTRFGALFVITRDGERSRRLATGLEVPPAWSPDSRMIAFGRADGLYVIQREAAAFAAFSPCAMSTQWRGLPTLRASRSRLPAASTARRDASSGQATSGPYVQTAAICVASPRIR